MSWEWVAGHVKDVSQDELLELVHQTMAAISKDKIVRTGMGEGHQGPFLRAFEGFMISVTPPINGWVTFWGYNHRFCSSIIRHNHLDGILFHSYTHRVPFGLDYAPENYWDYMYWEAGQVVDWFISDVPYYFDDWINEAQRDIVLPYFLFHELDKSVASLAKITDRTRFYTLIKENADLFDGDWEIFKEALNSAITRREFTKWKAKNAVDAIKAIPHFTNLPYSGLEYSIDKIGAFMELENLISKGVSKTRINSSIVEIEKQSAAWKKDVKEFKHIFFEYAPGVDDNQIYWENFDLFFYS